MHGACPSYGGLEKTYAIQSLRVRPNVDILAVAICCRCSTYTGRITTNKTSLSRGALQIQLLRSATKANTESKAALL